MSTCHFVIQSDWHEVLRDKGGKVWVAFKQSGEKTVYSELKRQADSGHDDGLLVNATDGFSIEQCGLKQLIVSYEDSCHVVHRCRFISPTVNFNRIHTNKKPVISLAVSSGGLAVSSDTDGQLLLWTSDNGEIRRKLVGHYGDIYTSCFFPSGVVIMSGGADTLIKIWSAETGLCAATLTGHNAGVTGLVPVERGRNIISSSRDGTARLWDCGKSSSLATFVAGSAINGCCLCVPPSHIDLLTADHLPDEREVLTAGKLLLIACEAGFLQGFGLHSRKKVFEVQFTSAVNCCMSLTDTYTVCGTQDSSVHLIDIRKTCSPVASTNLSRSAILSIVPHKQGCFITTGDGCCCYMNADSMNKNTLMVELTGADCDAVYGAATDGHNLFTCCRDSVIRRYRIDDL